MQQKTKIGIIWTIFGIIFMAIFVMATSTLNENGITTVNGTFTGTLVNYSTADASLKLYSSAHTNFGSNNGESIELRALTTTAKPFIGWYGYDLPTDQYRGVGWLGCHYNLTNGNEHSHCSFETLTNVTGTPGINSHFEIAYGGNLTRGNVIVTDADFDVKDDYSVYLGNDRDVNLRYSSTQNAMTLTSPQFRFNTGELYLNGVSLYLNSTSTKSIKLERDGTNDFMSLIFAQGGGEKWSIQQRNDGTNNLYIRDSTNSKNTLVFTQGLNPITTVYNSFIINGSAIFRIQANETGINCNTTTEGGIYYDGLTKKHYGCNSTKWNALY